MEEEKIAIVAQPDSGAENGKTRGTTLKKLQGLVERDLLKERTMLDELGGPSQGGRPDHAGYDQDGFKVPVRKIPLDGQFSGPELKELVELSKDKGLLKDDVSVRATASNEISKHMEIAEPKREKG
ncbi:hypothetical protein METBIDRAFT_12000 [Metschnikowia bicuspidata var. bicuspidata NRRL YB-4993]|uniref:Uncharacterized protein n=1 Tax=Metschnikowia bicuspidata var. bicuspidata NRRL YB-4993 TaxID=869754 RepID=A0A1A0HC80_9ASCO|nr:hypothetical protein METBIDRAFT_12000 [Metschnikowia bicuspidata var. bicuspidata NRRL YB-4993]OBA21498.1 hypothetical protein METBIDRAFT_12000 [Metschnikowia bicuspidata var. bicuspidata NRRL YB-4993]